MKNEKHVIENKKTELRLEFMKFVVDNKIDDENLVYLTRAADAFVNQQ